MSCDLATVLLALKLANGQIPPFGDPALAWGTANATNATGFPITGGTSGQPVISLSHLSPAEQEQLAEMARVSQRREQAVEKKRKDDKAFIDKTLKECGRQK